MVSEGVVVDAGVDWLTVTALQKSQREKLAFRANLTMAKERSRGNDMRPWSGMGYNGFACGQIQFGEREDSSIARVSGELSRECWKKIYLASDSVTRVDLQFTQYVGPEPAATILKYYRAAKRNLRRMKHGPTVQLWSGSDGSATLYLGKRSSEKFARCYNKEAESGLDQYRGCVRHEVEFKGSRAVQVIEQLDCAPSESEFASKVVREVLSVRSVYPAIEQDVSGAFPVAGSSMMTGILKPLHGRPADVLRSLTWLEGSVAATVQRLVDAGYGDEVVRALGLQIVNDRLVRSRDLL